jgi:hypothetical protein
MLCFANLFFDFSSGIQRVRARINGARMPTIFRVIAFMIFEAGRKKNGSPAMWPAGLAA